MTYRRRRPSARRASTHRRAGVGRRRRRRRRARRRSGDRPRRRHRRRRHSTGRCRCRCRRRPRRRERRRRRWRRWLDVGRVGRVGGRHESSKPIRRTSGTSATPVAASTRSRTSSINWWTSAAVAPDSAWMKLACFSETTAPPTRVPLQSGGPVDEPGGRVAWRVPEHRTGVGARRAGARCASGRSRPARPAASPGRPGRPRKRAASTTSASVERRVAVAEPELGERTHRGRARCGEIGDGRVDEHLHGLAAVPAGVHAHRAADRAGDADVEARARPDPRPRTGGPAPGARPRRRRSTVSPSSRSIVSNAAPEHHDHAREPGVGDEQVGAAPEHEPRRRCGDGGGDGLEVGRRRRRARAARPGRPPATW